LVDSNWLACCHGCAWKINLGHQGLLAAACVLNVGLLDGFYVGWDDDMKRISDDWDHSRKFPAKIIPENSQHSKKDDYYW